MDKEEEEEEEEEEDGEIGGLAIFCKSLERCILHTLRVLLCIKSLVGHVMCLKRPITAPFERSEPFHLLRLMGVSVPSLHIESTDSMIGVKNISLKC